MIKSKIRVKSNILDHRQEIEEQPRKSPSSSSEGSSNTNSPISTPTRLSLSKRCKKDEHKSKNKNKNPFSDRGLDKFNSLLAELEEKKQKIYSTKDSQDISLVRFTYSNTNRVVPIVVKVKKDEKNQVLSKTQMKSDQKDVKDNKLDKDHHQEEVKIEQQEKEKKVIMTKSQSFSVEKLLSPYNYFPVILVLILMLLAFSGRSFAILCTCIIWYVIPTLQQEGSSSSSSSHDKSTLKKKKDYARKLSENNNRLSLIKHHHALKDMPPPIRTHRNSW